MSAPPFWKNTRGEGYVLTQFVLIALILFGPRSVAGLPEWPASWTFATSVVGVLLIVAGGMLATAGTIKLGRNLTPFICPKAQSVLVERGAYRLVRHPIYSGLFFAACGWGLLVHSWLTLALALLLLLLFDRKAAREERWLLERFPGYADYRRRVRKLLPFVY